LHLGEVSPVGGFVGVGVKDGDDVLACTDRQPRKGVLGGLGDQRGEWGRACMAEEGEEPTPDQIDAGGLG
jgi:hypothetical protein